LRTTQSVDRNLSEVPEASSAMKSIIARAEATKRKAAVKLLAAKEGAFSTAKIAKDRAVELASEKAVQIAAASAAGGAAVGSAGGATGGLFLGGAAGALLGVVPAIFTFGLSIPLGAALGASCGVLLGGAAGTTTGAGLGGTAGYGAYTRRAEISSFIKKLRAKAVAGFGKVQVVAADAKAKVAQKIDDAKVKAVDTLTLVKGFALSHTAAARERATGMARTTKVKTLEIVSDKTVQVTAASATGGAAILGTGGAAAGFATGGAIGAAVGVVPALFTFGLSIPVFAAIGSGCGLATGAVVGGTTGLVGGGATGYGVYTKRDAIGSTVTNTLSKVDSAAKLVKEKASTSADYVRNRLGGATGGTMD